MATASGLFHPLTKAEAYSAHPNGPAQRKTFTPSEVVLEPPKPQILHGPTRRVL